MKTLSKVLAITLGAAAFALTTSTAAFAEGPVRNAIKYRHTAKNPNVNKEYKTTLKGKATIKKNRNQAE